MTISFNTFKKPCFWPIFGPFSQFWGKKFFSGKSSSVTHNFIWVSSTMPKFRKNERYNSKKTPGQKDGQTLFYRTLLATAGGPKRDCHAWKFSELPLCRNFRGGYTFFMCCVKPAIEKFTFPEKQLFFFQTTWWSQICWQHRRQKFHEILQPILRLLDFSVTGAIKQFK